MSSEYTPNNASGTPLPSTEDDNQRRARTAGLQAVTVLTLGAGFVAAPGAEAATFTVTNLNDAGAGSLRQAIDDANLAAGADIVTFQAGLTGTITLTTGQLAITDSLDIQGPGAGSLTVSGNNSSRVFYLYNGQATLDARIAGLTITGGTANIGAGVVDFDENLVLEDLVISGNAATGDGGGVWADGFNMTLTIRNSTISGNTSGDDGGGMYVEDTGAPMLIEDSVFSGNMAVGQGGGIYLYDPDDDVTIRDTTISGNSAAASGGGVYLYSHDSGAFSIVSSTVSGNTAARGGGVYLYGLDQAGNLLQNSTISGNSATAGNGGGIFFYNLYSTSFDFMTVANNASTEGGGGGVFVLGDTLPVTNSLIANNTATAGNADIDNGKSGNFGIAYSLVETAGTASVTDNGNNIFGTDPQIGALADNGGPTQTHLPGAMSPVLNVADPATQLALDQRGMARVVNGRADMGSVEIAPPASVITFSVAAVSVNETAGTITLTVTRTGSSGAVSVSYASSPGTATAGADYTTVTGMLSWPDGDATPRTIVVPIIDDALAEPAETFTVTLSNPMGATLGAAPATTVTILASDQLIGGVPVPSTTTWGQALLAALLAALAFVGLRRRDAAKGAALLLAAGLAGGAAAPVDAGSLDGGTRVTRVTSFERAGDVVRVRLADGTALDVPASRVVLKDKRGRQRGELRSVAADTPVRVKIKRAADGSIRRVRIVAIDPNDVDSKR